MQVAAAALAAGLVSTLAAGELEPGFAAGLAVAAVGAAELVPPPEQAEIVKLTIANATTSRAIPVRCWVMSSSSVRPCGLHGGPAMQ